MTFSHNKNNLYQYAVFYSFDKFKLFWGVIKQETVFKI